ncbi:heterokaryon incompatibility protein [Colletotrichum kahawae]|uniref:Heterokaryon incompatibility protein n=1 Tax=Colletotrichum kahawae TaxID=34407 RepID=A0AAD9YID5_COLKA|nr:heterokaryon incompatibility protein [Colletotrichum kahawae]
MNQGDVDERGHQVRLMPQIYSRARQVLIYVGEPSLEDDKLFQWMSDDYEPDAPRLPLQTAAGNRFRRRYFSRVWIIQEVALISTTGSDDVRKILTAMGEVSSQ